MRTALLCALAFVIGCGGGGGGGGGDDDDDQPPTDGPNNPPPDTAPPATSALGTTCTPDANNPQGTCPVGFQCLNLQDATNPWCSKTCTTGAGDTCNADYDGPGKAACILGVMPQGGGAVTNFCAVICMDLTGNNGVCADGECDGTCPGSLMCTADLNNNAPPPPVIGKVCE